MMSSVLILFVLAGAESFGYFDTGSMDCSNYHDRDACLTCDNTYDIGDDPSNTPRCYWQWSGQSGGSGQGDGPNAGTCTNEDGQAPILVAQSPAPKHVNKHKL